MIDLARLRRAVDSFKSCERGNITIELVTIVPLLLVITLGLITFFDAFQAKSTAARTSTVISDLVSRETNAITPDFMDGVSGLMQSMIESDADPEFRLTAFTWDDDDAKYLVRWSKQRGNRLEHSEETLNYLATQLPQIKDGQRAVLLETWVEYDPLTKFGMEKSTTFENRLVAAQRFVPQICYLTSETADITTAVC